MKKLLIVLIGIGCCYFTFHVSYICDVYSFSPNEIATHEIKSMRTLNSKSYTYSGKLITRFYANNIHFLKNGKFIEFDNSIVQKNRLYEINDSSHDIKMNNDYLEFSLNKDNHQILLSDQKKCANKVNIQNNLGSKGIEKSASTMEYIYDDSQTGEISISSSQITISKTFQNYADLFYESYFVTFYSLQVVEYGDKYLFLDFDNQIRYTLDSTYVKDVCGLYTTKVVPKLAQHLNGYELTFCYERNAVYDNNIIVYPLEFQFTLLLCDNIGNSLIKDKYIIDTVNDSYPSSVSIPVMYNAIVFPDELDYLHTFGIYSIDSFALYEDIYTFFRNQAIYTSVESITLNLRRASSSINPDILVQVLLDAGLDYDTITGVTSFNDILNLTYLTSVQTWYSIDITQQVYYSSFQKEELLLRFYPQMKESGLNQITFRSKEYNIQSYQPYIEVVYDNWYESDTSLLNCYAFSFDYFEAINPGTLSNTSFSSPYNLNEIKTAILNDMSFLGYTAYEIDNPFITLNSNEFIVAFRFGMGASNDPETNDGYHVIVRPDNNYWYEKPGSNAPSRIFAHANINPAMVYWSYVFHPNYDMDKYHSATIFIKIET